MPPKPDLGVYLGQRVTVLVDRPLGSVHPRYPDLRYPVNYGELPGTVSGDGKPIDAYLLGWQRPVETVQGRVVAVLERADDAEDKLVVVRGDLSLTDEEIMRAVEFQEQFFQTRLRR